LGVYDLCFQYNFSLNLFLILRKRSSELENVILLVKQLMFIPKITSICYKGKQTKSSLKSTSPKFTGQFKLGMEMGRSGDGFYLPRPPYPTLIYLLVTLLIPNKDEKSNLIPIPDGFGYQRPIPIPTMHNCF